MPRSLRAAVPTAELPPLTCVASCDSPPFPPSLALRTCAFDSRRRVSLPSIDQRSGRDEASDRVHCGAVSPSIPSWLAPMAATLTRERFTGPEWVFERKLDGIRLLAFKE